MQSAVEKLSPTSVRLTVEVPFEELKPSLDAAYKKIAGQIAIPGFRKGKVPPQIIDQRIGRAAVLDEAVNEAIPQLYVRALEENELTPLSQPEVEISEFVDKEKLTFTAEVEIRPEITVPEYSGLAVEVEDVKVSDEDVEEQLLALRQRFGTLVDVDRAVEDGDFVSMDLSASRNGEAIEDAQATDLSYQVGQQSMLDGLDEALLGMSAGESKSFRTKLVGGELAGEEVDVEVTVKAVKVQELPELDEEFAQTASEFDTVEELTADLRERLERGRRLEQASEARDAVLEKLLDLAEIPVPEKAVQAEIDARREQIREQLQYAGMTEQQYFDSEEQTEDEFTADLEKRSRDALAAQFLLDEIAKDAELGVDENELSQHIMRRAQSAGMQPESFAQQVMQAGQVPLLVNEVVRGKALAQVVEAAAVTDASGNPVNLKDLQADGSVGAPEQADTGGASGEGASGEAAPGGEVGPDAGVEGGVEGGVEPEAETTGAADETRREPADKQQ